MSSFLQFCNLDDTCQPGDGTTYANHCLGASRPNICSSECPSLLCMPNPGDPTLYCQQIAHTKESGYEFGPALCKTGTVLTGICQPGTHANDCSMSENSIDGGTPQVESTYLPGTLGSCHCLQTDDSINVIDAGAQALTFTLSGDNDGRYLSCPANNAAVGFGVSGSNENTYLPWDKSDPPENYRAVITCAPLAPGLEVASVQYVGTTTHDSGQGSDDIPGSNPSDPNWTVCPAGTVVTGFCNANDDANCRVPGDPTVYKGVVQCATVRAACAAGQTRSATGECQTTCAPGLDNSPCTCGDLTCQAPATCSGTTCEPTYCPREQGAVTESCWCGLYDICEPSTGNICVTKVGDTQFEQCVPVCAAGGTGCWCPAADQTCLAPDTCEKGGCTPPPAPPTPPPPPPPAPAACTPEAQDALKNLVVPDCSGDISPEYPPPNQECGNFVGCTTEGYSGPPVISPKTITAATMDSKGKCDLSC